MEQIDETLRAFVEALSSERLEENLGTLHALAAQLPPEDLVRGRIERILSWITLEQVYFSSTDVQFQEAVRQFLKQPSP